MKSNLRHSPTVVNVLPGTGNGNTKWFSALNKFQQVETERQVDFKKRHLPPMPDGAWSKKPSHTYPHILPSGNDQLAYYPGMTEAVQAYLTKNDIAAHDEVLNLKSSQAACLNFLFPFSQEENLDLATKVFEPFLNDVKQVTAIEFEYTGNDDDRKDATTWLGEPPDGNRGRYLTSIDAAIFWEDYNGKTHITLIEWKYTEEGFGGCSAFSQATEEERAICKSMVGSVGHTIQKPCMLTSGGKYRSRNYWSLLTHAGISIAGCQRVAGCVFQGCFYQLMRQHLLAAYLRDVKKAADEVNVVAFSFAGNAALKDVPLQLQHIRPSQTANVVQTWNTLVSGTPKMQEFKVEDLMHQVDTLPDIDKIWRMYIKARYGI